MEKFHFWPLCGTQVHVTVLGWALRYGSSCLPRVPTLLVFTYCSELYLSGVSHSKRLSIILCTENLGMSLPSFFATCEYDNADLFLFILVFVLERVVLSFHFRCT